MAFLYENLDFMRENGHNASLPKYIGENLNPRLELRPYQIAAFENFITHFESKNRPHPLQVLFHMATGSGKTLIMAGLMLYLYKQGYRNFLFFVNLSNIVEKTKENFLNAVSSKYLFAENIVLDGESIPIKQVENFQYSDPDAINICFTTIQGLHTNIWESKENAMTSDDFDSCKVVFISDEAHHLNVDTRGKANAAEAENHHSWENTVRCIFELNAENVLLEFTATCDLDNQNIRAAYENKIVFNYPLTEFYHDKYSKDIITLRSEASIMDRALMAVIISQYRLKVFQDNRLSIKPILLFKARTIEESKKFMQAFTEEIKNLTGARLTALQSVANNEIMQAAFQYFADNHISMDVLAAEIKDDFSDTHLVSVNDDKEATNKQILLNSLEDLDNPYRAIFEVKKLDEGWDVLNLFDIVRLYETRQSGGKKISQTTIAEAQLIGRGARYCPFKIKDDELKFQRKFDEDVKSPLRILETLYYHCQNDHRYVTELKKALREIGLNTDDIVQREYVLKDDFKNDSLYKEGKIFLNKRMEKDRREVRGLTESVRDAVYNFEEGLASFGADEVLKDNLDTSVDTKIDGTLTRFTIEEIAAKNYALVNKALRNDPIFKFNTLKSYFPNLTSTREFITSNEYLGGIKINIKSKDKIPSIKTLYNAVCFVCGKIAASLSSIEKTYYGTNEFNEKDIREVFYNKTVNYTAPHDGGVGISQNDASVNPKWKIDLSKEDWFAYTDNFGTSEEKAFVAYFKDYAESLKQKYSKVYLLRNEREFHIYSFEDGERFEPDYVLFLQKEKSDGYEQIQIFIEPKGDHLLEADAWKEKFLLRLEKEGIPSKTFVDDNEYKIRGFHFFNQNKRAKEFDDDFGKL